MTRSVLRIARKELGVFFASPVAFIFLGVFLAVTLFVFFWVETFFARNIADVRPLFEWMPILLIFLVAALTMRMWSEERRMGTLEFLLTSPVKPPARPGGTDTTRSRSTRASRLSTSAGSKSDRLANTMTLGWS